MFANLHLTKMLNRLPQDKYLMNTHGRRLIDLCISCSLLRLNGRLGSDNGVGAYTRIDTTGKSVVDYMIGSPELFAIASDFIVHDKFPVSDHVPLSIVINCRLNVIYLVKAELINLCGPDTIDIDGPLSM